MFEDLKVGDVVFYNKYEWTDKTTIKKQAIVTKIVKTGFRIDLTPDVLYCRRSGEGKIKTTNLFQWSRIPYITRD